MHGLVNPEMVPGLAGSCVIVTDMDCAGPLPQLLAGTTLMLPLEAPQSTFTVDVPCPLTIVVPVGTLQL